MRRAWLFLLLLPVAASAQEDYRASEPGRPLSVSDAYPLKLQEWEWEAGGRWTEHGAGERAFEFSLGVAAGLLPDTEFEIEVASGASRTAATATGVRSWEVGMQHNFNQETGWPAFAIATHVELPGVGDLARRDAAFSALGIMTRSINRLRVHVNAGGEFASAADGGRVWLAGVGIDYPIGLISRALLVDALWSGSADGADELTVEAGLRIQLSNRTVLDLGLTSEVLSWDDGANGGLVLGLSRAFGMPALSRPAEYREVRLD